jgi:hypothetical protein
VGPRRDGHRQSGALEQFLEQFKVGSYYYADFSEAPTN